MKWLVSIVLFGLIIFIHEFGHFIIAKLNGVHVEEFSIGFGPRLLSAVKNGTRYSLKLIVFGGSCVMKGMIPDELFGEEDSEDELNELSDDIVDKEAIKLRAKSEPENEKDIPDEDSFLAKPVGKRLAIILAGPLFNILLAFFASIILISIMGYDPANVSYIQENSNAEAAGLEEGDRIVRINGEKIKISRDVDEYFLVNEISGENEMVIDAERDGEEIQISFLPDSVEKYMIGISYYQGNEKAELGEVTKDSPAMKAGLKAGDVITSVNGEEIYTGAELAKYFNTNPVGADAVEITYLRGNTERRVTLYPEKMDHITVGFGCYGPREKASPLQVIKYSAVEIRFWIESVFDSLKMLITGKYGIDALSGPVGIVNVIGTTYEESVPEGSLITWMNMLYILILISANVGVMNLLPFPVLDGGRTVFLIIEMITGKRVNPKVEAGVNFAGAVLLVGLMIFVMYKDIAGLL
ncbi:MAG: RIP metalloprotease RseP [Lachnospiraceae bacterium]|jgi:regulator of sigma E protease